MFVADEAMVSVRLLRYYVVGLILSSPSIQSVTVKLDQGIFTGKSSGNVSQFLGIPYLKPPIGDLRLRLPQRTEPYDGPYNATQYGAICPQQPFTPVNLTAMPISEEDRKLLDPEEAPSNVTYTESEDCLTINIITPTGLGVEQKLPVLVWIYGGAFSAGGGSQSDGSSIVEKSIQMNEPMVYVSMNYRLGALGFLASREVKDAKLGNLGLRDQREALKWIQRYISNFGGDPTRVTIWGESAGAMSVAYHMIMNGGDSEGLFHAGFMQSGSVLPTGDITNGQADQDAILEQTNCLGVDDVLQCLRDVDYTLLKAAMDTSRSVTGYTALDLAWVPRYDGDLFEDHPQRLLLEGKAARIPFVNGDCDDEGTWFSLPSLNVTTKEEVVQYFSINYLPGSTLAEAKDLLNFYPSDPSQGSPYDTGTKNQITPEFKRIASLTGDLIFQAPRRLLIESQVTVSDVWSYSYRRLKTASLLGSEHAIDIGAAYGGGDFTEFLINFATYLNPNGKENNSVWPKYTPESPLLLTFLDNISMPLGAAEDTYRKSSIDFVTQLSLRYPM